MVPIGSKALMKGKLVHTNEILVCLGAQYFAKYSAKQAIAVCDRRIKRKELADRLQSMILFSYALRIVANIIKFPRYERIVKLVSSFFFIEADEMLSSLEKERNLLEMRRSMPTDYGVFGDDEKQEIIEPYVEEEEQQWRSR